jgi:hypothetical protein
MKGGKRKKGRGDQKGEGRQRKGWRMKTRRDDEERGNKKPGGNVCIRATSN